MKTVTIMRGLPASGKSTWAKTQITEHPGRYKRLNKDDLRMMLDNGHHSPSNEKFVERMRDFMLVEALREGKHVIIDDTNLSSRPIARIKQVIERYQKETGEQVQVEVRELEVSLEDSLARDKARGSTVGREAILRMYRQHILADERGPHYKPQDTSLPPAIICDLDGTLALLKHRKPFDEVACESDELNEPIAALVSLCKQAGMHIILMSGRQELARQPTLNWLHAHSIPFDALHMRSTGDTRKDAIVKRELFEAQVLGQYHVRLVLDDRDQVVDLWRLELGLPCLQVNYGDF